MADLSGAHTIWTVVWSLPDDDRDITSRCVTIEGYSTLDSLAKMISLRHSVAEGSVKIKMILRVEHEA